MCDKLVAKVNNIDSSGFALKTKYDTDKLELEKETLDTSELVKKLDFNAKIVEIENKIQSVSGLAADAALTAVENKIPNVSNLVKKKDYNTKINETEKKFTDHEHDKYITIPEFSNLAARGFTAKLKQISKKDRF